MSSELSNNFSSSVEASSQVIRAIEKKDLTLVQSLLKSYNLSKFDLDDIAWRCGRDGHDEIAEKIFHCFDDASEFSYLDGQLVKAIDEANHSEIAMLLNSGADLYQGNHEILHNYAVKADTEMVSYLIQLGLDPKVAFSDDDMAFYKKNPNFIKCDHGFEWLEALREGDTHPQALMSLDAFKPYKP